MKIKPKFGKETKAEEQREKKMSPAAYKRMEQMEGKHKYRNGGMVRKMGKAC